MKSLPLMLLVALVSASGLRAEEGELFDPETGMRISHYRAAVPPDVKGGKRIDIDELDDVMAKEKPLLLDVMPSEGPGADPATGQWSIPKKHDHIPGSTWLPDVGRGRVTPALECYFRQNLVRLTGGDKAKPIVLYCQSDCWMALERRETRSRLRLHAPLLVSRRHRWLARLGAQSRARRTAPARPQVRGRQRVSRG